MLLSITYLTDPKCSFLPFSELDAMKWPVRDCCPACTQLVNDDPVLRLGHPRWQAKVALMQCSRCGHVYYLNPPSEEFLLDFYRHHWNLARQPDGASAVQIHTGVNRKIARLLADLNVRDKNSPILDVGCGMGGNMAGLVEAGFTNVYGCEQSEHRAATSERRFPGRIFQVGYQGLDKLPELRSRSFSIIYLSHVLEHIYDPQDVFLRLAPYLARDGVLIVNVPNVARESVIEQALYLPHLHSFSPQALRDLGRVHGYAGRLWAGARSDELSAVFQRGEHAACALNGELFSEPPESSADYLAAQRARLRQPWLEAGRDRAASITFGQTHMAQSQAFRNGAYTRLDMVRRAGLFGLVHLRDFIVRKRLIGHSPSFTRLLRLLSTEQREIVGLSMMDYRCSADGDPAMPEICLDNDRAAFLVK